MKTVAVLASHPIQYQTPLFKMLGAEKDIDLHVYFCWDFGVKKQFDREFNKEIAWDTPLLEGYSYSFLKNYSLRPSSGFFGQIAPEIVCELFKKEYDTILVFGWNSFANWLVFLYSFFTKTKILIRAESPLNQELLKSKWKLFLKKIILTSLFKKISGFLYIGEENRKFYKFYGVPDNKLFFAPYAVDNDYFMQQASILKPQREALRKKNAIDVDAFVILFIGKLIEKKRPFDLLYAYELFLKSIVTKNRKTTLLFVGDGPLREKLEKYTFKKKIPNIIFTGFKNQTELSEYYSIADVFVLPSGIGETWGLVVNEAMCFGLPIIISDRVGCSTDLVQNGENGFIFPFGDISSLSENLGLILHNSVQRKILSEKSSARVKEYSYKKDIEGIKNF